MTIQQAQSRLSRGETVYGWDVYWGQWSEILDIKMTEHGIYQFRERTIGETRIRDHCTQQDKGDFFADSLPE